VAAALCSGGFTADRAGAELPKSHCCLCGATPAIAQNRSLAVMHFVINLTTFSKNLAPKVPFYFLSQLVSRINRVKIPTLLLSEVFQISFCVGQK
jgi:hypothetical protein